MFRSPCDYSGIGGQTSVRRWASFVAPLDVPTPTVVAHDPTRPADRRPRAGAFLAERSNRPGNEPAAAHMTPWADVMSIVGTHASPRTARRASRSLTDLQDTLARAVADLTG